MPATRMGADALQRLVVIGTSSAGKSTIASRLARILDARHVELDALFWDAGWRPRSTAEFVRLTGEATEGAQRWILDGNYGAVRERWWPMATHVVWLDYSLPRVLWRGLCRAIRRCATREELWHGNRESLRRTFLSRESILVWIATTHRERARQLAELRASGRYDASWVVFQRPAQAERWLADLEIEARRRADAQDGPR